MTTEEIKKFLSENGKKGGATNAKKGPEYFRWVVSHRKNRKNKPVEVKE